MAAAITLRVLTQEGLTLKDEALSVIAPGEPGYLGMLRNHAPLVTTLKSGKLIWRTAAGTRRTALVGDGLLEVAANRVTLLTDRCTEPSPEAQAS